jgi:formate dehydrogenase subunit delta
MANDIAAFFDAEPDKAAAAKDAAHHIKRFWEPRMRAAIAAHLASGGEGMSALSRAAVALLDTDQQKNKTHV